MDAIQNSASEKNSTVNGETATTDQLNEDDGLKPTESVDRLAARRDKRRRKRQRLISMSVVVLLLAGAGYFLWSMAGTRRSKINLTVKPRAEQSADDSTKASSPEETTNQAIAEARSAIETSVRSGAPVPGGDKNSSPKIKDADTKTSPGDESVGSPEQPPAESSTATPRPFRRNAERSIRFSPPEPPATRADNTSEQKGSNRDRSDKNSPVSLVSQPSLPPFGALLPVRSLGTIFTMRSGTARLELSRDVRRDGWSLSKGTVLVCNLNGSERDRAFLSLVGFIDPETNRLVKLTGEILGSDGGAGLKGKQHKLSSGWSRAFSKIGSTAINVAGAIAAGRISGQPVIVTDLGSRTINPVTREVDELVLDRSDGRSFVEVPAQSVGYILVTQLPETDTRPRDAQRQPIQGDGLLNDDELADILTSNDRRRIQAALPRMPPQIRKLAEAMLQEPEN